MINKVKGMEPQIAELVFVHESAVVVGDVELKKGANVWACAVLRGDMEKITIGEGGNVQDGCVLHTNKGLPLTVGKNVVLGHSVNLHSCEIGDGTLVGIGATVLDGAKIGKNSIVAAGSLVPPGKEFPDGVMVMGSPAKVVRELRLEEIEETRRLAEHYMEEAREYWETEGRVCK